MLVGRTFSYSDTQRYRVGTNYLQLPVNAPKNVQVATNQRDGEMAYRQDMVEGQDPSINYEPSNYAAPVEAAKPGPVAHGPEITGQLTRARIPRRNDYKQAGERFQLQEDWEKEDLIKNLTGALSQCDRQIQERMVWHFFMCDDEYGQRVGEGLGITADDVRHLEPLPTYPLNEEEQARYENLGKNGPRDVTGLQMTHCVPNEREVVAG
jgi:catalase